MPNLIRRIKKGRLYLLVVPVAILALVIGLPILKTNQHAHASNPLINTTFNAIFPGYPDGQTPQGERDYTYYGDGSSTVQFQLTPNGPVPAGTPTIEINGAANPDASLSVVGGVISVTVNNATSHLNGSNKLEVTITYPDGSCWHGFITIVTISEWDVGQPKEVTLDNGTQSTITTNIYPNAEVFPLVRSEGGSYTLTAQYGLNDNGAGGGNNDYQMVLSGLPDQGSITALPGATSHDFEFTIQSFALAHFQIRLSLVRVTTQEVICCTPVTISSYDTITSWHTSYIYDSTVTPVSEITKCAPCSVTSTTNETDHRLDPEDGTECAAGYTTFDSTSDSPINIQTNGGGSANGRGGAAMATRAKNIGGSVEGGAPQGGSLPAKEDPAKPESLKIVSSEKPSVTMDSKDSYGKSITTDTGKLEVADVVSNGYTINFYKSGGTQPETCLKVVRPTTLEADGSQALRYIEQRFGNAGPGTGSVVEVKYTQKNNIDGSSVWSIYEGAELASKTAAAAPESAFLRKTVTAISAEVDSIRTETTTVSERRADTGAWEVISCVEKTYKRYIWGDPLIKLVRDPGGRNLTSTWTYYTEATNGLIIGNVKSYTDHTGNWTEYEWDNKGRLAKVRQPFLNSAPGSADNLCKVLTVTYPTATTRLETTTILGTTVGTNEVTGLSAARTLKRVGNGESFSATINREPVKPTAPVASKGFNLFEADSYEVTSMTYPDGTKHTCSWSYNSGKRVRECKQGNAALTRGTKTVTETDLLGNMVKQESYALDFDNTASNEQLLSTLTRTNLDPLGRPLTATTTFADGSPAQVTTREFGCCGIRESTDIRGIVTEYHYDHLKRLETSTSIGVTRGTQYNGLSRKSVRIPEANAPVDSHGHITVRATLPSQTIVQSERTRNKAREMVSSKSPSPQHADGTTMVTTSYSYVYATGTTTTANYPDGGQSISVTARDGRTLEYYGSAITGNNTDKITYDYGPSIAGVTFGNGGVFGTKVTQANGTQWTISVVDVIDRNVEKHFADGAKATMHYNTLNQLVRSVDPDGVTMLYDYNDEGERTFRAADLNGNNTLDLASDRVTFSETNATTGHDASTYVWETLSRTYGTSGGNLETGKSQRSVDGLKSWNIPFSISARASSSTTVLAGGADWTSTSVSPTGLTSVATYTDGLLDTSVTRGANSAETLNSTSYFYDAHNRVDKTTDARTGDTTVVYLNNDQQSSVTRVRAGTNSLTTAFTYDTMGRTLTTDSPDSTDDQGNTLSNIVTRTYDKRGNVLTVSGDQTYSRDYSYDELSRLGTLKTFGTSTSVTTWNYNAQRGWLDSKKYPNVNNPLNQGLGTTYSYTAGGRLKGRGWARGVNTTWHYDFEGNDTGFGLNAKAGDLQGVTYSDGTTPATAYSYRRWGAVSAINDVAGTRTFTYNEMLDLTLDNEIMSTNGTSLSQQEVSIPRKHGHLYDSLGRMTHGLLGTTAQVDVLATAIGGGSGTNLPIDHVHAYGYDAQTGRISSVIHGNAKSVVTEAPFTCNYKANSNLPDTTTGPAHKVTNTYEAHRDVLKTKTNEDRHTTVTTISAITYGSSTDAVNGIGQREHASRSSSTTYNAVTNTEDWKYNANGEAVDANHSSNAKDRSYAFDGIGNRTSLTDNNGTTASTPNALNQLTSVGGTARVHDADGNLTDDGIRLYSWDAENRLVMVQRKSDNAVIAEYRYDYMSRRVYKETTAIAPQGAGAALFVYEGWNLCAEYTATAITGSTDSTITAIKRTYTWGQDLSGSMQGAGGVGGLLAIEEKSGTHAGKYYPLYDGNGNVTELVKSGGTTGTTLVAHYEYDPFGSLTQNDDSDSSGYNAVNPFRFSTKYLDEETGLYYYGYRYYDTAVGRWINRDPIEERGGLNIYVFVMNDGVDSYDFLGLLRPSCDEFKKHYPKYRGKNGYPKAGDVYDLVGGWLDEEHDDPQNKKDHKYQDSCALRITIALNALGKQHKIPPGAGGTRNPDGKNPDGSKKPSSNTKDRQIISARKLCKYLEKAWGPPDFIETMDPNLEIVKNHQRCDCICLIHCSANHVGLIDERGEHDSHPFEDRNGIKVWKLPCFY